MLSGVVSVFSHNLLPIFLIALLGYWLRRGLKLDKDALARVVFYALTPCLVFSLLVSSRLPAAELLRLALFAILTISAMAALGLLSGRLLGLSRPDSVALTIALMFVNGGNYGLTLNHLRYGDQGLARAVVYYVVSTVLLFTVGLTIAAMGRRSWRETGARLFRLPPIYAVALAFLVLVFSIPLPRPLLQAVELAGTGALPLMLVVLGMQMADLRVIPGTRLLAAALLLRLVAGPLVAVLVAWLVGLGGLNRSVSVIEASMPTAVIVTIVATEFDLQPAAMTSFVLVSTLISLVTLPVVISLFAL